MQERASGLVLSVFPSPVTAVLLNKGFTTYTQFMFEKQEINPYEVLSKSDN